MWWVFLKFTSPELHSFSEIEAYVVLLIFDMWIIKVDKQLTKEEN
jgi:hypothetical protein